MNKSNIMTVAWSVAKAAAAQFGGNARQYIGGALKQAWAERDIIYRDPADSYTIRVDGRRASIEHGGKAQRVKLESGHALLAVQARQIKSAGLNPADYFAVAGRVIIRGAVRRAENCIAGRIRGSRARILTNRQPPR